MVHICQLFRCPPSQVDPTSGQIKENGVQYHINYSIIMTSSSLLNIGRMSSAMLNYQSGLLSVTGKFS